MYVRLNRIRDIYLSWPLSNASNGHQPQQVYWGGELYPLCGIGFWDDNIGARTICRGLGFFNGSVQKTEDEYTTQALIGYGLATPRVRAPACAAGEKVGMTITCSKNSTCITTARVSE